MVCNVLAVRVTHFMIEVFVEVLMTSTLLCDVTPHHQHSGGACYLSACVVQEEQPYPKNGQILFHCAIYAWKQRGTLYMCWAMPGGIHMSLRTGILLISCDALQQTLVKAALRKYKAVQCCQYVTNKTNHVTYDMFHISCIDQINKIY